MIKTAHLLFEQSGTFKRAFSAHGIKALDYDLENQFNQTDFQIDLFDEIEKAYSNQTSIFDGIDQDDLIFAFFPCTYFSGQNHLIFNRTMYQFKNKKADEIDLIVANRERERERFFNKLLQLISVCKTRKLRLVIENPYQLNYLIGHEKIKHPDLIITNRRMLGDYFRKPTAFWFYNFEPTTFNIITHVIGNEKRTVSNSSGIDRSLMSDTFASNFINKFILGF